MEGVVGGYSQRLLLGAAQCLNFKFSTLVAVSSCKMKRREKPTLDPVGDCVGARDNFPEVLLWSRAPDSAQTLPAVHIVVPLSLCTQHSLMVVPPQV